MKKGTKVIVDGERLGLVTKGGAKEVEVQFEVTCEREMVPVSCCSTETIRAARAEEVYPGAELWTYARTGQLAKVEIIHGDLRHVNPSGYYVLARGPMGDSVKLTLADLRVDVCAEIRGRRSEG